MRFAGKTVVITGAASGIGKATCLLFASEGATVIAGHRVSHGTTAEATDQSTGVAALGLLLWGEGRGAIGLIPVACLCAVARAVAPDLARLREMHDVFGRVARPLHVCAARAQRRAHAVHAGHEVALWTQRVQHRAPHARHDAHVDHHVGRIGDLDTELRDA